MRSVHYFESTGDAYDATQCDDKIADGDTLVVLRERVVGVADTWPIAITGEHGNLHRIKAGSSDTQFLESANLYHDRNFLTQEDLDFAREYATRLGFELAPFHRT
jgi:hypothetical protein